MPSGTGEGDSLEKFCLLPFEEWEKVPDRADEGLFTTCFSVLLDFQRPLHDADRLPSHADSRELTLIHIRFKK